MLEVQSVFILTYSTQLDERNWIGIIRFRDEYLAFELLGCLFDMTIFIVKIWSVHARMHARADVHAGGGAVHSGPLPTATAVRAQPMKKEKISGNNEQKLNI